MHREQFPSRTMMTSDLRKRVWLLEYERVNGRWVHAAALVYTYSFLLSAVLTGSTGKWVEN